MAPRRCYPNHSVGEVDEPYELAFVLDRDHISAADLRDLGRTHAGHEGEDIAPIASVLNEQLARVPDARQRLASGEERQVDELDRLLWREDVTIVRVGISGRARSILASSRLVTVETGLSPMT
ncbi:hypothetical protein [Methylosinus sporium]|uniref:hypothetical protein n=1 Tax=Methylosinus sporium TaxID=428 RepID=UPI00383AC1C4